MTKNIVDAFNSKYNSKEMIMQVYLKYAYLLDWTPMDPFNFSLNWEKWHISMHDIYYSKQVFSLS